MLVIASTNGRVGLRRAMDVLRAGGSAVDAVEAGTRLVESNPDDHTVGYGGLPNLIGEVELDASIMDGATLAAGAVGALKGYEHAVSVARRIMDEMPHLLLVGEGAARFAREAGFPPKELLTEAARKIWEARLYDTIREGEPGALRYQEKVRQWVKLAADPERPNETVNFIAVDGRGNLASAASTSGWAWKYPGRIGDSPIIGAGNYADNRYGAACCTGRGEMAIRCGTARSVVLYLKLGMYLEEACLEAMGDLRALTDPYAGALSLIAVDAKGGHLGVSNRPGTTYVYVTDAMHEPAERERLIVNTIGSPA
jgi:beta-aspartyl-peptidase (threonine type)